MLDTERPPRVRRVFSQQTRRSDHRRMSITTELPTLTRADLWRELGQQLRVDAIRATAVSGSGHPTSAMSGADLIAVLAEKYLRYDFDHPDHPNNDHLIFSKGHASPLLYALYKAAGAISDEELLTTRTLGSPLEGHPSAALPWVDVATGSLGFGLPVGVGIALAANPVDGHDVEAIDKAYTLATAASERPSLIVARTVKGKGVAAVENQPGWHGKVLPDTEAAIAELGGMREIRIAPSLPPDAPPRRHYEAAPVTLPAYELGTLKSTRRAYGEALATLGDARDDVVAMDGEVSNSTFSGLFAERHPERFFEMFVAEQQMIAAAIGFGVRGLKPFTSAFAAFFSRAYDFIRMAAISRASLRIVGSHAGVATGEDGPSQMALEDLAMFRAVHGSTVLYPSDANQTAKLVELAANNPSITYLRTTRADTPVIYAADTSFSIGGSRLLRATADDDVTVAAAGITVHEAVKASELLADEGIRVRVLDLYSVKPIDRQALLESVTATGGRLVTVEDHWPEGGLGDAVFAALADSGLTIHAVKLAVRELPGSGRPAELLHTAGIDAETIVTAVDALMGAAPW